MVDSRSIFHAEHDAVGRFSFLLLIFEYSRVLILMYVNGAQTLLKQCSIYIHVNQHSKMRKRNEKWLTASCSAWKILLESTIRIPANLPLLCSAIHFLFMVHWEKDYQWNYSSTLFVTPFKILEYYNSIIIVLISIFRHDSGNVLLCWGINMWYHTLIWLVFLHHL